MKTFREYLDEMAINTGTNRFGLSKKVEFNSLEIFNPLSVAGKMTILLKDNYSSMHYKIFKYGAIYYLSTDENNYLGYLELEEVSNNICKINASHSKLKGGFYNLFFTFILSFTKYKEILSDISLSDQAITSYSNLNNKSHLNIRVKSFNSYFPFSKEKLTSDVKNRVSITEAVDLLEYYYDVNANIANIRLFTSKNPAYDEKLFCEPIGSYNCSEQHLEEINYFKGYK